MKFVLAPSNTYWWPVIVRVPDPEAPGKLAEQTMKMQFEPRDQDAERAEYDRIQAITDVAEQLREERASLMAVCKGWDDVTTPDGSPLPFNQTNLDTALQQPWFRLAVWTAYHQSISGQEARLGN